jgi:hypothetical protein
LPAVVERIVERVDPLQVILFGSLARGEVGYDSDIELLVSLPKVAGKRRGPASPPHLEGLAGPQGHRGCFMQTYFLSSHNLDFLRTLLPSGWLLKENPPGLAEPTEWAVGARYPGDLPEASEDDARIAVGEAREVYETALEDLRRYGYVPEDAA